MCCKRVIRESYFVLLPPRSTYNFDQLQLLFAGHQQLPPTIAAAHLPPPSFIACHLRSMQRRCRCRCRCFCCYCCCCRWSPLLLLLFLSLLLRCRIRDFVAVVLFRRLASFPFSLCCFMCKNWFLCTFRTHTKTQTHTRAYELLFIKYILWKQRLTANYKVLSATGMGT